jgi:hypothetical protein
MDINLTIMMKKRILMVKVDTKMRTLAAGIKGIALAASLLVGMALVSCGPNDRPADAPPGPNLPSGVARPATATATAEAQSLVPAQIEVTRIASEPSIASPTAAANNAVTGAATVSAATGAATTGGFTLLVLHTNDVRGYTLPCG